MARPKEERRKQIRVKGAAGLMIGVKPQSPSADIRDISLSGISFIADSPIEFMTQLVMTLLLPVVDASSESSDSPDDSRIQCEGAVVRCDPTGADGDRYEVAVFFMHLDETAKAAIERYVRAN
jgi:hypothetical protein